MCSWNTMMIYKHAAIKHFVSRQGDREIDKYYSAGLQFSRVNWWRTVNSLLAMQVASTELDADENTMHPKATRKFSVHRTPSPVQVFLGTLKHLLLFGTLLTSVHGMAWNCYFPMGNWDENYSFRPSRSICCCCCWTQTLWSPWRPLSSADFRSSGGQRSSPLSTSPDSVGSTTIDGSLLDSLGYFSRESGKAWWDIWGHICQVLPRVACSEQSTCSILASLLHLTCTPRSIKRPLQTGAGQQSCTGRISRKAESSFLLSKCGHGGAVGLSTLSSAHAVPSWAKNQLCSPVCQADDCLDLCDVMHIVKMET